MLNHSMKLKHDNYYKLHPIEYFVFFLVIIISACNDPFHKEAQFKLLSSQKTGIHFINVLEESHLMNIFTYPDFYSGGHIDLLLCGNINNARIRFGKYDANYGLLLEGDGKGRFMTRTQPESEFKLWGDVRSTIIMDDMILFVGNGSDVKAYQLNQ